MEREERRERKEGKERRSAVAVCAEIGEMMKHERNNRRAKEAIPPRFMHYTCPSTRPSQFAIPARNFCAPCVCVRSHALRPSTLV